MTSRTILLFGLCLTGGPCLAYDGRKHAAEAGSATPGESALTPDDDQHKDPKGNNPEPAKGPDQARITDPQPVNALGAILNAFDKYRVVALGEAHGLQEEHDFIHALIGNPAFAAKVLGLVHDPHPAAADLADDAIIPDAIQLLAALLALPADRPGDIPGMVLEVLDHHQRREDLANLLGQLRMAAAVFLDRRTLPPLLALEEFFHQHFDRGEFVAGFVHGQLTPLEDRRRNRVFPEGPVAGV
jgi:hypothetical protein